MSATSSFVSLDSALLVRRPGADAYGPKISSWFSDALGIPCTLVRQQPRSRTVHRQTSHTLRQTSRSGSKQVTSEKQTKENSIEDEQLDSSLGFANEGQFLLVNTASVDELNRRMKESDGHLGDRENGRRDLTVLEPERFRPNLVVRDQEPFEEDTWQHVQIGGQQFSVRAQRLDAAMESVDDRLPYNGNNEAVMFRICWFSCRRWRTFY